MESSVLWLMHNKKGQSLIEILVVIALMAIVLPAIISGFIVTREARPQQQRRLRAAEIIKETQEAVRIIRENGWSNVANDDTYYPVVAGNSWTLTQGSEIIDGITREIIITSVYRENGRIVTSGGSLDPSTKAITIRLTWNQPFTTTIQSDFYLTRYLENETYIQTKKIEDFDTGVLTDVITTQVDDGEVTLGAGGSGSWCAPSTPVEELDLPKNGVANALTAIKGKAFATTGENASGVSFAKINITTNTNPPDASIPNPGTFDGYKTNDVFGETNYAYIATDTNDEEIVIINLTNMTKSGWFNASGSTDADSIYVYNNRGYMTQGSTLRIFDLSSKSGSRSQLGAISLYATGTSVVVQSDGSNTYAYVSIAGHARELQIINVTNPNSLTTAGYADVNGQAAQDISINDTGTRAYLITSESATQREFFIIDITSKTGSRPVVAGGSYDTNGMSPKAVALVPGNKAIVVGQGSEEYQVINIVSENSPSRCGGIQIDTGINDVASVLEDDGDAFSYILTGDASTEFKIIEGGPGGNFATNGTYESATYEIGYTTAFNRFLATTAEPINTGINFQIAIADAVSGSCSGASFSFTGPDGTANTYYETGEPIAFSDDGTGYENPGRCLRYRAYLSTEEANTAPVLEDVTINYSP